MQQRVTTAVEMARRAFPDSGHVTVYDYADCRALYVAWSQFYQGHTPADDGCNFWGGGVVGYGDRGGLFLNDIGLRQTAGDWGLAEIVVHEYFHNVQSFRAGALPANAGDPATSIGPVWLTEGSADYEASRVLDSNQLHKYIDVRNGAKGGALYCHGSLKHFETLAGANATCRGGQYSMGFMASELLARGHGEDALINYWQIRRTTATWQEAFHIAFGVTVDDFYAQFDGYKSANFRDN